MASKVKFVRLYFQCHQIVISKFLLLCYDREWTENGQLWVQQVSSTPATRLDVVNLQVHTHTLTLIKFMKDVGNLTLSKLCNIIVVILTLTLWPHDQFGYCTFNKKVLSNFVFLFFCCFFLQLKFYCMLLWNNFNFSLCQCKLTVFRSNLTCVFNSDKLGKQESVPLGESFTHNALVSFYVIVLYCKCYFIVCQICHSQVFLL